MLDVSNLRISLAQWGNCEKNHQQALRKAAAHALHVPVSDIASLTLLRRSIDARHPKNIKLVCSVRIGLAQGSSAEQNLLAAPRLKNVKATQDIPFTLPEPVSSRAASETSSCNASTHAGYAGSHTRHPSALEDRPIVVGAGSAGLFCALALAHAGLEPLLIERGDSCERRSQAVATFFEGGPFDQESNIQFGLGGAGTFSDGKLQTGTKAASHRFILESFVEAGADPSILVDAHPHIGSDVLPRVVEGLRKRIEELGGEVRCRCRLTDIEVSAHCVVGIKTCSQDAASGLLREERIACSQLVLATGHSARDVFELLQRRGATLERKPFAMGLRIEHLQASINRVLYGAQANNPVLGPAPYKLACHMKDGRGVFSFCMCPGGTVVAATSEAEAVVTNGMSSSARDAVNANAALLVGIEPQDLKGSDVFAGIELQRSCERAAFVAGGENYAAPAQLVGDFLRGQASTSLGAVQPSYPRGVQLTSLEGLLPCFVIDALREAIPRLGKKLSGFDTQDALLTGVETRSSSPVRVLRTSSCESLAIQGLWPAGEGAGYAGGIMSAAADGLRVAAAIASAYESRDV